MIRSAIVIVVNDDSGSVYCCFTSFSFLFLFAQRALQLHAAITFARPERCVIQMVLCYHVDLFILALCVLRLSDGPRNSQENHFCGTS
jgi:hypothetical protein